MPNGHTGNGISGQIGKTEEKAETSVVDFRQARAQKIDEKRRKAERIFFKQLLSVYCVTGDQKMRPIDIVNVSEDGMAFQVPVDTKDPWPGELKDLPIRMYFSQDTFIEIHLRIKNTSPSIENGVRTVRYGCSVDTGTASYAAYNGFVQFLKAYAEHAHKDNGKVSVFYL